MRVLLPLDSVQLIDVIEDFVSNLKKECVMVEDIILSNWQRLWRKSFPS
ncbi:hypothetical protein Leryth_027568 [Lithospermum erythrorhizon]|nr:hypothetical protein Leryth_027568 [Lithospermum erythrorhizon]